MPGIRRLVLDVQKPINLPSDVIAIELSRLHGIEGVDLLIQDVDQKVETAKITLEGESIVFEDVKSLIERLGATIQSVDRITAGKRIVG